MLVNADLHIHSKYSMATSGKMDIPTLATESAKKGIQLVATGDCLHPKWLAEIKKLKEENGIFRFGDMSFIITTEVEDANQVHHLLIVPSISKAEELYEFMKNRSNNIDSDGRPIFTILFRFFFFSRIFYDFQLLLLNYFPRRLPH